MLSMLSEASIASWCSPSQASPSYTPSRRRLRLRHWCSPKQISLVQTPRAEISRLALAGGSMLLQNLASSLSKVLFTTQLASELAGMACPGLQCGFCPPGPGRRRSALYGMPPAAGDGRNSFEFYGEPRVWQASEAIGSFAKRTRQPHHIRSTPSIKGLPHTRHASSHHRSIDRGPWGS